MTPPTYWPLWTHDPQWPALCDGTSADPGNAPILCEWLLEQGATLAEILTVYAGLVPDYADGLPLAVVAEAAQRLQPDGERLASCILAAEVGRTLTVKGAVWRAPEGDPANAWMLSFSEDGERNTISLHATEAAARLHLKRRVLRLFADVTVERVAEVLMTSLHADPANFVRSAKDIAAEQGVVWWAPFKSVENKPARCLILRQRLRPEQFIPPESSSFDARWGHDAGDIRENLRRVWVNVEHEVQGLPPLPLEAAAAEAALEAAAAALEAAAAALEAAERHVDRRHSLVCGDCGSRAFFTRHARRGRQELFCHGHAPDDAEVLSSHLQISESGPGYTCEFRGAFLPLQPTQEALLRELERLRMIPGNEQRGFGTVLYMPSGGYGLPSPLPL